MSLHKRFNYTQTDDPGCEFCGNQGCDCIDRLTAPDWYAPTPHIQMGGLSLHEVDKPTKRVRCGNCGNNGTGLSNPACDRPIHRRQS